MTRTRKFYKKCPKCGELVVVKSLISTTVSYGLDGKPTAKGVDLEKIGFIECQKCGYSEHEEKQMEPKKVLELAEARKHKDMHMVMEGDDGGQIYLSIPVKDIKCGEKTLKNLLLSIDRLIWQGNLAGACVYYDTFKEDKVIPGGMGGGLALDSLWLHDMLKKHKKKILEMIQGKKRAIKFHH